MKKIAILGDIHGNNLLLTEVLNCLKKEKIDDYIFCGDYLDGFESNEVLNIIRGMSEYIIAGNGEIAANNYDGESWENSAQWSPRLYSYKSLSKDNLNFISNLPIYKIIEIDGVKICISHGSPYGVSDEVYAGNYELFDKLIKEKPCDVYLFSHTHAPFEEQYRGKLFVNAGAINCSSHGKPVSSYGILTLNENKISYDKKEHYYDPEKLKNYYLNSDYHKKCPEWSNFFIYTLRDGFDYFTDLLDLLITSMTKVSHGMISLKSI